MCYMVYELALNSDIQQKLYEEIETTLRACDGQISYGALAEMKYLDNVVSETLRKWSSAFVDRKSIKPFIIEPELPDEKSLHLEAGTVCWIPVYPLHRDPSYYPDPEKFDPERFSNENKHKIKPYAYMPFGSGPRICIGSRFALLEIKVVILELLLKFEIVPIKKTTLPIVFSKKTFAPIPDEGFWLGLKSRSMFS